VGGKGPVLVIGATGRQGGAVTRHLLDAGRTVHAFVRHADDPAARALAGRGVRLVRGDLDDPVSLRAALAGADAVFCVLTFRGPEGVAGEERRGKRVADLFKELGLGHLVYSSVGGADRATGVPHFESKARIEERIAELDLPATILRPAFLMDNFVSGRSLRVQDGEVVVAMPLEPGTALQMVAADDIGAIAADAFGRPAESIGAALEIAGDEVSGAEIAETFGAAYAMPSRFISLPVDDQVRAAVGTDFALMFEWFNAAGYRADIPALRGRYPFLSTLQDWVIAHGAELPGRGADP
jgi:uncharacterized protein YbjT (DUF2867 family)